MNTGPGARPTSGLPELAHARSMSAFCHALAPAPSDYSVGHALPPASEVQAWPKSGLSTDATHSTARDDDRAIEEQLLRRLAQGDDVALGELYDRLARPLFALALQVLHDRSEAEDVVHDAFLAMREKAGTYVTGRGSVIGWAITLTRNRAIDRLRLRRRRGDLLAQADPGDLGYATPTADEGDAAQSADRAHLVRQAFAALPPDQRDALHLAYFSGLTQAEIAERLRTPLGTVKARMRRGLLRLRALLPSHL